MKKKHICSYDSKLSTYGLGEWVEEPDHIIFKYESIKCRIKRISHTGHLCGYVKLPFLHTWSSLDCTDFDFIKVHGGITYSRREKNGWWIGFDCAHCDDFLPFYKNLNFNFEEMTYKNVKYVIDQCTFLAQQVIESSQIQTQQEDYGLVTGFGNIGRQFWSLSVDKGRNSGRHA